MLLIMTGCVSTTRVSVEPIKVEAPVVLMVAPKPYKPIPEGMSLKDALSIITENNSACVDNSQKLEFLQEWVRETNSISNVKDGLF